MTSQELLELAALAVLVLLAPAFLRVWRGPALDDRLLGLQALGTSGTALLLILAHTRSSPPLVDVALVMALLSALTVLTLTRLFKHSATGEWP